MPEIVAVRVYRIDELTSDAVVDEALAAHGCGFTADGRRFG